LLTLGIAGHVDHGKTSLVRALTGIDTDRLPEERRRGISIELGFAHLDLAGGRAALVDMPGHERFVRRMIAGAAGIDAVLLVVAADEGVMPQAREHLAICQLLGVQHGAIVLTKTDLVDPEMRAMALADVAELVHDTFLAGAAVWPVSVRQPDTLVELKGQLSTWLLELAEVQVQRQAALRARPFRLAVDRAFSLHGRGTVVAGSLGAGRIAIEDVVDVWPGGRQFRVRSLEQHSAAVAAAEAPGRLALNLAGATLAEVPIGSTLALPGTLACVDRCDARLRLLVDHPALSVRSRAMLHIGTSQTEVAVVQLAGTPQAPGTAAWVQLQLDRPLPLVAGDRFVLRGWRQDPRLGQTLAGGQILCVQPRRHKLGDAEVLAALGELADGKLDARVLALARLADIRGVEEVALALSLGVPADPVQRAVRQLLGDNRLRRAGGYLLTPEALARLEGRLIERVRAYHQQQPQRPGVDIDGLGRELGDWLPAAVVAQALSAAGKRGVLEVQGSVVKLPGFSPKQVVDPAVAGKLVDVLRAHGLMAPDLAALSEETGRTVRDAAAALAWATAQGHVVRLAEDVYLAADVAQVAADRVLAAFVDRESFSTGELKDLLGLSRKYLIPFAEHLDAVRLTVRDPSGNRRVRDRAREAWRQRQSGGAG
jgi:selenocysteine-specific elongation factor